MTPPFPHRPLRPSRPSRPLHPLALFEALYHKTPIFAKKQTVLSLLEKGEESPGNTGRHVS